MAYDVSKVRSAYPALADGYAYLDGAAGTQLPDAVIDAIAGAYRAGLRGVWLDRPGALPSADPAPPAWVERITSLAELPALLGRPPRAPS